jgi:hypothetical protein
MGSAVRTIYGLTSNSAICEVFARTLPRVMFFATGVNLKLFLYEAFRDHQNVISVILPLRQTGPAGTRWKAKSSFRVYR